eukprot:5311991-Prymnesium_polylepis.1
MLVALLEHTERAEGTGDSVLCAKGRVIEAASTISEQPFRTLQQHLDAAASGAKLWCAAFQQMVTLATLGFVKQRARKQLCASGVVYELTESGRVRAAELRRSGEAREAAPLRHARRPAPDETVRERERERERSRNLERRRAAHPPMPRSRRPVCARATAVGRAW